MKPIDTANVATLPLRLPENHHALALELSEHHLVFVPGVQVRPLLQALVPFSDEEERAFRDSWDDLHLDTYMGDGGRYRRRRHAAYQISAAGDLERLSDRPHYQTVDYNHLNGGVARHFEPITDSTNANPLMRGLLQLASDTFRAAMPYTDWFVEAHQFRIEPSEGGGKPTPEGAHRDGVNFVLMAMINRRNIEGGETAIYDADRNPLTNFTLASPLDVALVNDERVVHGVSPVHAIDHQDIAFRDVLVLTFRAE